MKITDTRGCCSMCSAYRHSSHLARDLARSTSHQPGLVGRLGAIELAQPVRSKTCSTGHATFVARWLRPTRAFSRLCKRAGRTGWRGAMAMGRSLDLKPLKEVNCPLNFHIPQIWRHSIIHRGYHSIVAPCAGCNGTLLPSTQSTVPVCKSKKEAQHRRRGDGT